MSIISRLGVVLGLDTAEFNKNLGIANNALKQFATVAGASLTAVGLTALKYADQINDVAKANEVAVETVLELSTALTLNGGEAENVGKLFSSLANKLDEAGTGNKKAEETFAKLGVSISDIKKLSPDELFRKTLNSLAQIENPMTRNAMAMELFGKAIKGIDIKGMNADLEKTKGAFEGTATAFKNAGDAFDILDRIFMNMKAGFAVELGGAFKAWAQGAERFVQMLVAARKELAGLFEDGSVLDKYKADGGKGKKTVSDIFGGSGDLIQPVQDDGFTNWTGKLKTPQRTSPLKTTTELADAEKARKDEIARLDKMIAAKEAKQAEADRQKIKDAEKYADQVKKQTEDLERKLVLTKSETEHMGKTLTEVEKLNLEFQKGGAYDKIKDEALKKRMIDAAAAKDLAIEELNYQKLSMEAELEKGKLKHDAREANKLEIKTLETATERLGIEKSMAGESDTQVQLALRYYDLQQAILDKKEKGLETDQQIYDFAIASMNNIEAEEANTRAQNTFQAGWNKAYNNFVQRSQDSAALGAEAFSTMYDSMSSALDRFVETGKLSFGSLVTDMIKNLLRLQMQASMSGLFGMLGGGSGGGVGLFSSSTDFANGGGIMGFLGGMFADGGSPPVGVPSLVGERGAELFVPRTAGTIIPNNQLSSMMGSQPQTVYNGTVIQNMSAIDTQSGVQFLAKNKNAVFAANQSAQRGLPQSR
jgi:lambda family phage tail tape measure protein